MVAIPQPTQSGIDLRGTHKGLEAEALSPPRPSGHPTVFLLPPPCSAAGTAAAPARGLGASAAQ